MSYVKEIQYFKGYKFIKYKDSPYFKGYVDGKRYWMHRYVWSYHNGEIEPGNHIHHIDHDPSNNHIDNLMSVTPKEHIKLSRELTEEQKEKRRLHVINNMIPASKAWHKSEEGRKWHSGMAKKSYSKRKFISKECSHCHNVFKTRDTAKNTRFCHQNCKMKARRRRLKGLREDASL